MELFPPLHFNKLHSSKKVFPLYLGAWLWGCVFVQPQEHYRDQAVTSGEELWGTVFIPVYLKGVK